MPKVSVVIPVYNVEAYIERCLHSLFGQTLDDIEYVFVDDGSTDGSAEIIERVLEQYKDSPPRKNRREQTKILHHDRNRGVAAARTTGIRAATGDYIIHCDADDWVERDMYEKLYSEAVRTDSDIVACYFWYENPKYKYQFTNCYGPTPHRCLKDMYRKKCLYQNLWDKLVRREIITRHDIVPFEGLDYGEDLNCVVRIFYYSRTISVVGEPLYHYRRHANSMMGLPADKEILKKHMRNVDLICDFLHRESGRRYEQFCDHMKFCLKRDYQHLLYDDEREWFDLYHECYRHVLSFNMFPLRSRLIIWLAMRNFRLYRIMRRMFYDI